jgi:hypothetical protein
MPGRIDTGCQRVHPGTLGGRHHAWISTCQSGRIGGHDESPGAVRVISVEQRAEVDLQQVTGDSIGRWVG